MANLPDVTFAEGDVRVLVEKLKTFYEAVRRAAGEPAYRLADGDPVRLIQLSESALLAQVNADIEATGKGNLLYYAGEETIEHLGYLYGERGNRIQPAASVVTIQYTLSAVRSVGTVIPAGSRTTPDNILFFATVEQLEIPAGQLSGEVQAKCLTVGAKGNGFDIGEIKNIVDRVPFVATAVNITLSTGGADLEDIEAYRDRIWLLPESFSVAGPEGAYRFWAMTANANIVDVAVWSPLLDLVFMRLFLSELFSSVGISIHVTDEMAELWRKRFMELCHESGTGPMHVNIVPLMRNGGVPTQEILDAVYNTCNGRTHRPLTDCLHVLPPRTVEYKIKAKYWTWSNDAGEAVSKQVAVVTALAEYKEWQSEELGRDLNPSKLTELIMKTGVKRVEVEEPVFTQLDHDEIGVVTEETIVYGGLEDA